MVLSRFWYVVVALVLGAAAYVLFLATSMYDRAGARAMGEALNSDMQVVTWYLKDDARMRAGQLIKFAASEDIQKGLAKASESEDKVPREARDKVQAELTKVNAQIDEDLKFDAVFAVDQHGRVVARIGYDQASGMEDFELGGYPVVADALHGYVRDDTLVLDRVYRVVGRPVEFDTSSLPAGAIIGARMVDERFTRELSQRTGAAVAFYANGERVAAGAPEGFDRAQLDQIVADLDDVQSEEDYSVKGRSKVRTINGMLGVIYARLPGESWELGAGYAVGRLPNAVGTPLGFFNRADDKDKAAVKLPIVGGVVLLAAALGLIFSFIEHTRPLQLFRAEAQRMAKGEADQLAPSKFRGIYRKIASDLNDGVDHVAAKGGAPRKAADLGKVLGDLPAQPQMSAFSFPGDASVSGVEASVPSAPSHPKPAAPGPARPKPKPPGAQDDEPGANSPPPKRPGPPPRPSAAPDEAEQEAAEWQRVFEEFVATKQQCGENVEGFTYEKFEQTLIKNKDTLVKRHGAKRVKFSVYVKDGKAALKASPIKE